MTTQARAATGWRAVSGLLAVLMAAHAQAAEPRIERFYGYAYDGDSGRYLYTEVHSQTYEGPRWLSGTIRYYAPDGSLIGNKTLDFSADSTIPVFRTELTRERYVEAITAVTPGRIDMEKIRDGKRKTVSIERDGDMAADSGFHSLLVAHFPELLAGRTVRFRFAVAGQLETYRFRVNKVGESRFEGQPAVQLRVEPDSLLRILAGPLTMTYGRDDPHLLEYRGLSNIHDPATGSAYNVRIIYPSQPPADAPKTLPPLQ